MSLPRTAARLPDELVIEIFSSSVLSRKDLYRCSLVARRFVTSVNAFLYEIVRLDVWRTYTEVDSALGETEERIEYSKNGFKLIRTLVENPKLADLVERVYLDEDVLEATDHRSLDTTQHQVLSNLLRLAPNVKSISFSDSWIYDRGILGIINRHKNATELEMEYTEDTEEDLQFIAQKMPQIKFLGVKDLTPDHNPPNLSIDFPSTLETISLRVGNRALQLALVKTNFSILQSLTAPLHVALELDFSLIPVLKQLYIQPSHDSATGQTTNRDWRIKDKASKFWSSICASPALQVLCLRGGPHYKEGYEAALFDQSYIMSSGGPKKSIQTLRTIRFEDEIDFNRVNCLLTSPLGSTIHRVVIPSRFVSPGAEPWDVNKYEFVSSLCQKLGIEVVLAERREGL
ncbi:hypothetical protein JCM5350_001361 [Sporobolomyces pararoseus]